MVLTNNSKTTDVVKKKATQGRQKIEIKKIEQLSSLQVTFSKRRAGIFKKASELCVLTGAEVGIVVQSPGGRVFAFGHPSVDHIVEKYLTGGASTISSNQILNPNLMNQRYAEINKELEEEKKKKKKDVIDQQSKMVNNDEFWWDEAVDGLTLEQLQQFVPSLVELKKNVLTRIGELMTIKSSSSLPPLFDVKQTPINQAVEYVPLGLDFEYGRI